MTLILTYELKNSFSEKRVGISRNVGASQYLVAILKDLVTRLDMAGLKEAGIMVGGALIVGWVGWMSNKVVDLAAIAESTKSTVIAIDTRINSISNRLPTELALHAKEVLRRPIKSAVLTSRPFRANQGWFRVLSVYNGEEGNLRLKTINISAPSDTEPFIYPLWNAKYSSEYTETFGQMENFYQKYGVLHKKMPDFIDKKYSFVAGSNSTVVMKYIGEKLNWADAKKVELARGVGMNYEKLAQSIGSLSVNYQPKN